MLMALAQKLYLVRFPGEMSTIGIEQLEKTWQEPKGSSEALAALSLLNTAELV